jgi:hypothetical protein
VSSSNISARCASVTVVVLLAFLRGAAAQSNLETAEVAVSGAEGATLLVDGKQIGVLPLVDTMILSAGPHRFQLLRGGQKAESDALMLPAHRFAELHLRLTGQSLVAVLHIAPSLLLILEPADLPAPYTDALTQAVAEAAKQEHVRLLRGDRQAVLLHQKEVLLRCIHGEDCHDPIFGKGELSYVLSIELARAGSGDAPDSTMSAALLNVPTRDNSLRLEERCSACSSERAAAQIRRLTARMLSDAAKRSRGTLAVTSKPPDARLFLDGRWLGMTPYRQAAATGKHTISVQRDGYQPEQRLLTISPGRTRSEEFMLSPLPIARGTERSRPLSRLIAGGILFGSGVLIGSFGASALAMHGKCQDGTDQLETCTPFYNTRAIGGGLLGGGAALAITGAVLLAVPGRLH